MIYNMIGRNFSVVIRTCFNLKSKTTNCSASAFSTLLNTLPSPDSSSFPLNNFRSEQLSRLQSLKPSEFSPLALNQLIVDFLISNTPDLPMATKLIDKFLFKIPGIDSQGDLATLYILQLIQAKSIPTCVNFLKSILNKIQSKPRDDELSIPVTPFMLECVWRTLIDKKDDSSAFELLQACYNSQSPIVTEFINFEFLNRIILNIFLPHLNWPAIDLIIEKSVHNNQITISSQVILEIFHVLLHPNPHDIYTDPIDAEMFTANVINPRFHRLIEVLERWKNSGIPIKGLQISKALEENFKRFLPTESMMNELQKLI